MMSAGENKQAVLKCVELFNECTLKWVDACYSNKLEWIELPKPDTPQGRRGDFAFYRKSAEQLLSLFPDRKITVIRSVAEGDCVVLEQEWQGTAAFTAGNYAAGRIAKLRAVSFFTLNNGLIIKQTDYCVPEK
jgi:ketosteroid isomerase-like protein